jgi:hypothetical protein
MTLGSWVSDWLIETNVEGRDSYRGVFTSWKTEVGVPGRNPDVLFVHDLFLFFALGIFLSFPTYHGIA